MLRVDVAFLLGRDRQLVNRTRYQSHLGGDIGTTRGNTCSHIRLHCGYRRVARNPCCDIGHILLPGTGVGCRSKCLRVRNRDAGAGRTDCDRSDAARSHGQRRRSRDGRIL